MMAAHGKYQFRLAPPDYCLNPLLLRPASPAFVVGQPDTYRVGERAPARMPAPRFLFTGTRKASPDDPVAVHLARCLVAPLPADSVVMQGGAPGWDTIVAVVAHSRGLYVHTILPAMGGSWATQFRRENVQYVLDHSNSWEQLASGDPIMRDEVAVGRADWVIGVPYAPQHEVSERRSGTWATLRRAWAQGKTEDNAITLLLEWQAACKRYGQEYAWAALHGNDTPR